MTIRFLLVFAGLAPEPETCKGCYSVLWTGVASKGFRPICHAVIRNVNEQ